MKTKTSLDQIRERVDLLDRKIIRAIADRAETPQNIKIYKNGSITAHDSTNGISMLDLASEGFIEFCGSLGRWDYPDQYVGAMKNNTKPKVSREVPESAVNRNIEIELEKDIKKFHLEKIVPLYKSGDDPEFYGESAYEDAVLLALLNERIIGIGRTVAQTKLDMKEKNDVVVSINDPEALRILLRNKEREAQVIDNAQKAASGNNIDSGAIAEIYNWVIQKTIDVEVFYLQKLYEIKSNGRKSGM